MRWIEEYGTQWPVLSSWTRSRGIVFEGREGILKVEIDDGGLIDPARRQAATASRSAGWELVRTRNGTALVGSYRQSGASVIVAVVRADEMHTASRESNGLSEIQATYVFGNGEDQAAVSAIRNALEEFVIPSTNYGRLDAFGHAAMGPVPILTSWAPVGESVDTSGRQSLNLGDVHVLLVGGGYLVFADDLKCCGFTLEPMPWRDFDVNRVLQRLEGELTSKGLAPQLIDAGVARVWQCQISESGLSYGVADSRSSIRGIGAFWKDAFSQVWRIHYWFGLEHGFDSERSLRTFSPSALLS